MDWERSNLVNELKQGKEVAEELRKNLNCIESPEILVDKLLFSYEKALSMLNWNAIVPVSDQDSKADQNQARGSKKRKMEERCSEKVKVRGGNGLQGPVDDGFSWRKYGQKDILGSNFPRAYYRCSHRHSQGCLAVKQVQRSNEDPSILEVTYRGRHTCVNENTKKQKKQYAEDKTKPADDVSSNSGEGSFVETNDGFQRFPSFSFLEENTLNFVEVSQATSEWNYLSTTSSLNEGNFGVQTPESGLTDEITSFLNSNSIVGDFDFYNFDFDSNFTFDNSEFHA